MDRISGLRSNMEFLTFMEFKTVNEILLEEKMRTEKDSFRLNGVMDLDEVERGTQMAYTLFFKKYDQSDTHLPDKFRAVLVDQPERQGLFLFDDRHPISAHEAFHILNGRSVMKPGGDELQLWYQMNFKKQDANGDCTLEMFSMGKKHFDIESMLARYPIKETQQPEEKAKIITALYNGQSVPVTLLNAGREKPGLLEANPKEWDLRFYSKPTPKQLQSLKQNKADQKMSWEIPFEKRSKKKRGMSL